MAFFPLPHKATLKKRIDPESYDRSGQIGKPEHEATGTTISKCLFYGMVGGKKAGAKQEFDQTIAFYCEASVPIGEGDIIENVTGPEDAFEEGPFEVLRVTRVTSFSGKVHHLSCKLKGNTRK